MAVMFELRRRARQVVGPLVGSLLLGYFAYHAIEGDRGLLAWRELDRRIAEAEATLADIERERGHYERRVAMLHPDSLDRDLLEERARALLNLAHADDIVIVAGPGGTGTGDRPRHAALRQ